MTILDEPIARPSAALTRELDKSRRMLARWAGYAEKYWYPISGGDDGELGCFGTGYNSWGVQTNQKYIGAIGVPAMDEASEPALAEVGISREHLLKRAMAALRYEIATHHVGNAVRTDGSRWGHTWISGLGIERMMHAVDALWPMMTEADRSGFLDVLASEADWLLEEYQVGAFPWASLGPNHPESNLWNGAILLRAAMMMPGHSHADRWTEKAHSFLLNGISVPRDDESDDPFLGRPLSRWHKGANFFPNFSLDHHSYQNIGYMVICLSNVAMLHYAYALRGRLAPPAVYHHAHELWKVVRGFTFSDGRLLRLGGDSRIRYCYCQDYLLPTLVFAADHFADSLAPHLEAGQIQLLQTEQRHNGGGSFLQRRLEPLKGMSSYYYTRLEADKAVCLAMQLQWRRMRPQLPQPRKQNVEQVERQMAATWQEPEHSAIMIRRPTRVAAVSWRACEAPQTLCLPPDDGSLAEWSENLAGRLSPQGEAFGKYDSRASHPLIRATQQPLEGGFVTCGSTLDGTWIDLPEGYRTRNLVRHHLAIAALPDGHTMLRMELARLAPQRAIFNNRRGFKLNVPCDIFNRSQRTLHTAGGSKTLRPRLNAAESLEDLNSNYFNVQDRLGGLVLYGAETFQLYRPGKRRGGLGGSLYYDEVCLQATLEQFDAAAGELLLDNGTAIFSSLDHKQTAALANDAKFGRLECRAVQADDAAMAHDCRAIWIKALDGHIYLLLANFYMDEADAQPRADETPEEATPGARTQPIAPDDRRLRNSSIKLPLVLRLPAITGLTRAVDLATGERFEIFAAPGANAAGATINIATTPGQARLLRMDVP